MIRKIIKIDEDRCSGCGACVSACHQGAIGMVGGKAKLLRDDYCDGLGNCLPVCPCGAISFEEREAATHDVDAVKANAQSKRPAAAAFGCPGMMAKSLDRDKNAGETGAPASIPSSLRQWPVQIKLVPPTAPYFKDADLLIAADCAAYAYGNFHAEYMKNMITIIGCPKLDDIDYSEKLTAILSGNDIKSVTVARMEVPCCGGLENAVKTAIHNCGKSIRWRLVTITIDGKALGD